MSKRFTPPIAETKPKKLEQHGHVRSDPYFWLADRNNPKVISHLKAENKYAEKMMSPTAKLQEKLFKEIKFRTKQDDTSVPYKRGDYFYYTRYEKNKNYPIFSRKKLSPSAREEILLDINKLARGHAYYKVGNVKISSDQMKLAFAVDYHGNRIFEVQFKDLKTGKISSEKIKETGGNIHWSADDKYVFYNKVDPETVRSYQIHRHEMGAKKKKDTLIYEEVDDTFDVYVTKSKSQKYLIIGSTQTMTSEMRYLPADEPLGEWKVFEKRRRGVEYSIDHLHDRWYVHTNLDAKNFRVMTTPEGATSKRNWKDFFAPREGVFIETLELFKDYAVILQRRNGQKELYARTKNGWKSHLIDFPEDAYDVDFGPNEDPESNTLRFVYSSLSNPDSEFDYDLVTRKRVLLKEEEIYGGFRKENYQVEALRLPARDGTLIPVSIVYRKDLFKKKKNPLLVYGYGSYGISIDPGFHSDEISLVDRGFIYAIAHIRGGQELGREWYEAGKLLKKKNTFTDFIDVTEGLVRRGYGAKDRLYAKGGSAGGLLMGAVINMRPDLYNGVVADVPFVDVVTTMLDETIPLTTSEFDEWGNPKNKKFYDYMLSYSPYDNVKAAAYPNMLVESGLYDSQVAYFEPAKWVSKLRAIKTDENLLLFRTNMSAGHGGGSARDQQYRETAFEYAFLVGLNEGLIGKD